MVSYDQDKILSIWDLTIITITLLAIKTVYYIDNNDKVCYIKKYFCLFKACLMKAVEFIDAKQ